MPDTEGSINTGWLVLFDADETRRIAKPVGDYVSPIATISAFIPDPIVTKIISLSAAALTLSAKKAAEKGKCLGIYVRGRPYRYAYLRQLKSRDLARFIYARSMRYMPVPFLYDERNPESLASWRRAVGMPEDDLLLPDFIARYLETEDDWYLER
jgi:hypothetical protein